MHHYEKMKLSAFDAGHWTAGPRDDQARFNGQFKTVISKSTRHAPENKQTEVTGLRSEAVKTLLLIDNVRLSRECLVHLLQSQIPAYDVVSAASIKDAEKFLPLRPDAVLLNIRSTKIIDAVFKKDILKILEETDKAPVLLLSDIDDSSEACQAADTGLSGLFPSNFGIPLLIAAINLVIAGGKFYAPTVSHLKIYRPDHKNGYTQI